MRIINWASDASVPGIDFDHFRGKASNSVLSMVNPRDEEVFAHDEKTDMTKGVRIVEWSDGECHSQ